MRVLYLHNMKMPNRAANTVQVMKMCAALAASGHEVTLAARPAKEHDPARGLTNEEAFDFYAVTPSFRIARVPRLIPGQSSKDPWATAFSLDAVRYAGKLRRDHDLIYTRLPLTALLSARKGIPVVYEAHRPLPDGGALSTIWRRAFVNATRRASFLRVVSISRQLADIYERDGCPTEKMLVAHDAVDLERFEPRLSKAEARIKHDLPADRRIVVYCGHLYQGRGTGELLECARMLPDALFLFVGGSDGDVRQWRERAEAAGLSNTKFTGFVPNGEIPAYLFAADALAMPYTSATASKDYMSPMKVFEYMAAERPIVATDFASVREVLTDGVNAILVPPDSASALADGLRRALQPEAVALGTQAYASAQHFTWSERVATITAFIDKQLSAARRGQ